MMTLYFSPFSPYARKVRTVIREAGLLDQVNETHAQPLDNPPALAQANPLNKVPTLVCDDGLVLMNSHLICEYLADRGHNTTGQGAQLYPAGDQRWQAKRLEALADGVMDAIVNNRIETALRETKPDARWTERWRLAITRTCGVWADEVETFAADWHIGSIAVAVALEYIDLRYPDYDWRAEHPTLVPFFKTAKSKANFQATYPQPVPA